MFYVFCVHIMEHRRRDDKMLRQIMDRLRALRKARGLTLDAVRVDTGIDLSYYESRLTNLSITTIAILCSYYEITLRDFFDGINLSDDLNQWS